MLDESFEIYVTDGLEDGTIDVDGIISMHPKMRVFALRNLIRSWANEQSWYLEDEVYEKIVHLKGKYASK